MIKKIYVKNYILIDELTVEFDDGLNVITGETGAGKSILINAIDIAFGSKSAKDTIKSGCDKAIIELYITNTKHDLTQLFEDYGIDDCGTEIILSREITQTSSRTRVNGTLVNQDFVKLLKDYFVDIHSQHQTYAFLQPKLHIKLLDNYAKTVYGSDLAQYKLLYKEYQELLFALESARLAASTTENQIEFLKFQLEEIQSAEITDVEEEDVLKNELSVLENAEKLKELTQSAYWTINNDEASILSALLQIKSNISKAAALDKELVPIEQSLIDISERTRELSSELRNYAESVINDTERLNYIQERLYLFDKLKRKYGKTLEEILFTFNKLKSEYDKIEFSSQLVDDLQQKIDNIVIELSNRAEKISQKRKDYAEVLSSLIVDELEKLELAKSRFKIDIQQQELSIDGIDKIEFLISTNVSEDLKPIAKVASGGEISRVMLAIKSIFAQSDDIDTVIFDEIDTGISGRAAQAVADEIAELSKFRQIIVITHHAIIASKADRHFLVSKTQSDSTLVNIVELSDDEKIEAIARLASGDTDSSALEFARSLLKQ